MRELFVTAGSGDPWVLGIEYFGGRLHVGMKQAAKFTLAGALLAFAQLALAASAPGRASSRGCQTRGS